MSNEEITFDEEQHKYTRNGDEYISVTTLLKKYGLSADYTNIPPDVLKKASERGTAVHKSLEEYIKYGTNNNSLILTPFEVYIKDRNIDLSKASSEELVYNDIFKVAGTIDFQYEDNGDQVIADFKTTSSIHWDSVIWQLSIYNYIKCGGDIIDYYTKQSKVFHIDGTTGSFDVKDLPLIPIEEVENLLTANLTGQPYTYTPDYSKVLSNSESQIYAQICDELDACKLQLVELEHKKKNLDRKLIDSMHTTKQPYIEVNDLRLTLVERSGAQRLDTKKVKELFTSLGIDINDYLTIGKSTCTINCTRLNANKTKITSVADDVKELNTVGE